MESALNLTGQPYLVTTDARNFRLVVAHGPQALLDSGAKIGGAFRALMAGQIQGFLNLELFQHYIGYYSAQSVVLQNEFINIATAFDLGCAVLLSLTAHR